MKINGNTQIPNMVVYGVLYSIVFGIGIWLLTFHKENPTNWILYVLMTVAVFAGVVKLVLNSRKRHRQSEP